MTLAVSSDFFHGLKTQYQQLLYFQNSGYYIPPQAVIVGHRLESQNKSDSSSLVPVNATAQYVPLKNTCSSFFALPGIYEKGKAYFLEPRNGLLLQDFVDGNLWTSKALEQAENKLYVPFMLFF